jgi:predicted  nucleic acid-binding Zn ribbon protein
LVARLERAVEDLDVWQTEWQAADTDKLRGPQRERFRKALADLKAKVAAMESALG